VRRTASALLLLTLLAAGCTQEAVTFPCPGNRAATLAFTATLAEVGCRGFDPASSSNVISSAYAVNVLFTGTLSFSASGNVAALCGIGPSAEPLIGTQVADVVDVALDTRGALLSACNPRCAVTVRQVVQGMLARGPGGLPSGFSGTLFDEATEVTTITGTDCTPCVTPCWGNYLLTGIPVNLR